MDIMEDQINPSGYYNNMGACFKNENANLNWSKKLNNRQYFKILVP